MRKTLSILAVVLFVAMALSACGTKNEPNEGSKATESSAPKKDVQLTFWMQNYGDREQQVKAMDEIVAGFKDETGIEVRYDLIDWNSANQKYSLAMSGGESPDVAEYFFLSSFAKMGGEGNGPMQINDIAQEMDAENLYYPSALNETKIGDDYYGLPWRMDTRIMIYRTDHFAENGIEAAPKTWDELVETAKKLTVKDGNSITRSGMGFYVTRGDFTQSAMATLAQNDAAVLDFATNEVTLNEPNAIEALQFMQDLVLKHEVISPSLATPTTDSATRFFTGEVSMLLGVNPDFLKTLEVQAPQLLENVAFAELPSKTGTGNSSVLFAAPVSVFNSTKHPEEAKQFLKYFLKTENQIKLSKATGLINANKEVMEDEMFNTDWYRTLSAQAERAENGDLPVPYWGAVSAFPDGPVSSMVSKVLFGNEVKPAADEAAAEIESIIAQNQ